LTPALETHPAVLSSGSISSLWSENHDV